MKTHSSRTSLRRLFILVPLALVPLLFLAFSAAPSSAAVRPAPAWGVTVAGVPSVLPAGLGRLGKYDIAVENVGGANSEGVFEVKDMLPAGLSIISI